MKCGALEEYWKRYLGRIIKSVLKEINKILDFAKSRIETYFLETEIPELCSFHSLTFLRHAQWTPGEYQKTDQ